MELKNNVIRLKNRDYYNELQHPDYNINLKVN